MSFPTDDLSNTSGTTSGWCQTPGIKGAHQQWDPKKIPFSPNSHNYQSCIIDMLHSQISQQFINFLSLRCNLMPCYHEDMGRAGKPRGEVKVSKTFANSVPQDHLDCLFRCSSLQGEMHQEILISRKAGFVSHPKYATITTASQINIIGSVPTGKKDKFLLNHCWCIWS